MEEGETVSTEKEYEFAIENDRDLVALFDEEDQAQLSCCYAYALNIVEKEGFFLSNDNVEQMSKEFTLGEKELREALKAR